MTWNVKSETKICQNCKNQFTIEPDDFLFYDKIKVPPPTFCPDCRFIRRMNFRNERSLYKRICNLCSKSIVSMYAADAPFPVYCRECWYSDKWDASSYGRDYDFKRPFFEQLGELFRAVPQLFMWQRNVVNSDYANMTGESRNVYLSASVVMGCENIFYSKAVDASFNIVDSYSVKGSDNCYENIYGDKNYNSHFLDLSRNCLDCRFIFDCVNCKNCLLSANLRNKQFFIRNKQYSKENYFKELQKIDFGNREVQKSLFNEFTSIRGRGLHKFANIIRSPESTGNNLVDVKNGKHCFDVYEMENVKYCYRAFKSEDVMDYDFGGWSELVYEYTTGARNLYNVRFSYSALDAVTDAEYTDYCMNCKNIFGCVSLKNKENSILNKSYSAKEFSELRLKIISQMNEMPYRDKGGRAYRYGEYFPVDISPFAYNESGAQDFFPLTKETAIEKGYRWRDVDLKTHVVDIPADSIPLDIKTVGDEMLKKNLGCSDKGSCNHQCSFAFRLIPDELQFYKKNNIPIPEKCPNCRYYERFTQVPPPKLWKRNCMCDYAAYPNTVKHTHHPEGECPNSFETSYSPDRPEIVYCESCYNSEVA